MLGLTSSHAGSLPLFQPGFLPPPPPVRARCALPGSGGLGAVPSRLPPLASPRVPGPPALNTYAGARGGRLALMPLPLEGVEAAVAALLLCEVAGGGRGALPAAILGVAAGVAAANAPAFLIGVAFAFPRPAPSRWGVAAGSVFSSRRPSARLVRGASFFALAEPWALLLPLMLLLLLLPGATGTTMARR